MWSKCSLKCRYLAGESLVHQWTVKALGDCCTPLWYSAIKLKDSTSGVIKCRIWWSSCDHKWMVCRYNNCRYYCWAENRCFTEIGPCRQNQLYGMYTHTRVHAHMHTSIIDNSHPKEIRHPWLITILYSRIAPNFRGKKPSWFLEFCSKMYFMMLI